MAKWNAIALGLVVLCGFTLRLHAAPTTFVNNEAGFLAALAGPATTYDFETGSGFPADLNGPGFDGSVLIGPLFGVNFSATVIEDGQATSGVQAMSTATAGSCCFGAATVDFSGLATLPTGVGFWGLDLINIRDVERIRTFVTFTNGGNQVYDVTLGGLPEFTPIHFGVVDPADTISAIAFVGTDTAGNERAWLIDDLTHDGAVPEPTTTGLMVLGLLALTGHAARLKH